MFQCRKWPYCRCLQRVVCVRESEWCVCACACAGESEGMSERERARERESEREIEREIERDGRHETLILFQSR